MTNQEKKKENILIKVYILVLFLCGIGLWFAMNNAGAPKQKLSVDVELEQKLVDALAANGVKQTDIISQYTRERETTTREWNEFYKKIQLSGNKRSENYENSLRAVARSMKLGLSKTDNVDGTVTYKFYSSSINYSNITFVNPKKPASVTSSSKPASTVSSSKPAAASSKKAVSAASSSSSKKAVSQTSSKPAASLKTSSSVKKKVQAKAKK